MSSSEAVEQLGRALDRWRRAKDVVASGWRSDADIHDRERRLMELDEAIFNAEKFRGNPDVDRNLEIAHAAMMGGAA